MKVWDFKTNSFYEFKRPSFGSRLHGDENAVFDFNERRYMKQWSYTKKQRRAFHRCISGLLRAKGRLERIRFMTLTSSPQSDRSKLNYHFNLLVKQIEYTFGFKMQYWKVKTNEGYGVLHVLFRVVDDKLPRKRKKGLLLSRRRRGFIPHCWLSKTWEKIHGAKVVEIHELRGKKSERDIAYYVVGNYVSRQPVERMSYSQKWVCKGFSKKWKIFLETYGERAIEVWDKWLTIAELSMFKEIKICDYGTIRKKG
jgi:hypothetical protein